MAGQSSTTTGAKARPVAAKVADDRDQVPLADLARGVLSKEIRPRAADVRRLAEAVLAGSAKKARKDARKAQAAKDGRKKDKSKKKLAKIPGQQTKK